MDRNRNYFSYSQLNTWETSKKQYWKRYGLGETFHPTKYMQFGSEFMKRLEFGEGLPDVIADNLPVYAMIEKHLEVEIKVGETTVKLLAILDTVDADFGAIIDYKTGKNPWAQADVDENTQLLFYSTVVYLKTGIIPNCMIVHVESVEGSDGKIDYTGNIYKYYMRPITKAKIRSMIKRIEKAIVEIEEFEYVDAPIADELVTEYRSLAEQKKAIEERMETIKDEFMLALVEAGSTYSETDYANISLASRTTYTFNDKEIKAADTKLKALKAEAILNGKGIKKESKYILFKAKN